MRLIQPTGERVFVEMREDVPVRLVWRNQPYRVEEIVERYRVRSRWHLDTARRGISRRYYRLLITPANRREKTLCVDLYCERKLWALYRVAD